MFGQRFGDLIRLFAFVYFRPVATFHFKREILPEFLHGDSDRRFHGLVHGEMHFSLGQQFADFIDAVRIRNIANHGKTLIIFHAAIDIIGGRQISVDGGVADNHVGVIMPAETRTEFGITLREPERHVKQPLARQNGREQIAVEHVKSDGVSQFMM